MENEKLIPGDEEEYDTHAGRITVTPYWDSAEVAEVRITRERDGTVSTWEVLPNEAPTILRLIAPATTSQPGFLADGSFVERA